MRAKQELIGLYMRAARIDKSRLMDEDRDARLAEMAELRLAIAVADDWPEVKESDLSATPQATSR